jgi:hypothetical protein
LLSTLFFEKLRKYTNFSSSDSEKKEEKLMKIGKKEKGE